MHLQLAVPMHCEGCASSVKAALEPLGVDSVECNVEKDQVFVNGDVPPSAVLAAITATGKDAIIRGTGEPDSAAVCILEDAAGKPHGLVRIVQTDATLFDLSVDPAAFKIAPKLVLSSREFGDISNGALSTGKSVAEILTLEQPNLSAYEKQSISVKSLLGRSLVLAPPTGPTASSLVGIVARSAGSWELDKTVCSCTGLNMWQETRVN